MMIRPAVVLLASALLFQEQTDRQLLERLKALIDAQLAPPLPTIVHVPCGSAIRPVLDAIPAGGTVTLAPGCPYPETLVVDPKASASEAVRVTITTQGWTDKGLGWAGLVTPTDLPRMATMAS